MKASAWPAFGKSVPLLFEHSTEVVGHIDPQTMVTSDEGLGCRGQVIGRANRGALSGAASNPARPDSASATGASTARAPDGGRDLSNIDLPEISVTSKPVHQLTRVMDWKGGSLPCAAIIDVLAEAKGIDLR